MRVLKLTVTGVMLFFASALQAQVSVSVNIGIPPQWGPAGYTEVRYYYLPDVEAYYDIHSSKFICFIGGKWIYRSYLPRQYRSYDLYGGYKVVISDYHGNTPYTYFNEHKAKYARGYKGQAQKNIGERPGDGNNNRRIHSNDNLYKTNSEGKNIKKGHSANGKSGKKK